MNDDERSILKEFQQNDQELEEIAKEINLALKEIKEKAQNVEANADKTGQLLEKQNERADKIVAKLTVQSNDLKQAISKHKNGQ